MRTQPLGSPLRITLSFLLLLTTPVLLPTQEPLLQEQNGFDWMSWRYEFKVAFIGGFMLGWAVKGQVLLNHGLISLDDLQQANRDLDFGAVTVDEVIREINLFYEKTHRMDWPLWVVVFMRNVWRDLEKPLPPWVEMKKKGDLK